MLKNKRCSCNDNGFTLIEVLVALALFSLIGIVAMNIFVQSNTAFRKTINGYDGIVSSNTANKGLSLDIREAQNPTGSNPAVLDLNDGKTLYLYYHYSRGEVDPDSGLIISSDTYYKRIEYRLNPNDNSELQRGWISTTTAPKATDPQPLTYANITNFRTVLKGLKNPDHVFAVTAKNGRYQVDINYTVMDVEATDPNYAAADVLISTGYLTRSNTFVDSAASTVPNYVEVSSITLSFGQAVIYANDSTISATVSINPAQATISSFSWSKDGWFEMTPAGNMAVIDLGENTTGSDRSGTITISTLDGLTQTVDLVQKGTLYRVTGLSAASVNLGKGVGPVTSICTVSPAEASGNTTLTWTVQGSAQSWLRVNGSTSATTTGPDHQVQITATSTTSKTRNGIIQVSSDFGVTPVNVTVNQQKR